MKKTKLKYRSAVTRIPPVKKVAVSSCNLEKLDLAIASKVEQNQKEQIYSELFLKDKIIK